MVWVRRPLAVKTDALLIAAAILGMTAMPRPAYARAQQPSVSFVVRVDSAQLDAVDVSLRVEHAPATLRVAMKVHRNTTPSTGAMSMDGASTARPTTRTPASCVSTARSGVPHCLVVAG